MQKKTFASIADEAKTKKGEKCSHGMEHRYDYLFLHLIAQEGSYTVLRCRNCGEIVKEQVEDYKTESASASESELVMN